MRFAFQPLLLGSLLVSIAGCVDEPTDARVAEGWAEQLRGILPQGASDLRALANHWDSGVAIFQYSLPAPRSAEEVISEIEALFAKGYLGYRVVARSPGFLRLQCDVPAQRHWWAAEYEFRVCPGGRLVVGTNIGHDMSTSLRQEFEQEGRELARRACGVEPSQ